jgi:hypothetical protein
MLIRSARRAFVLCLLFTLSGAIAGPETLPSPVHAGADVGDGITTVSLDLRAYAALKFVNTATLSGFPLSTRAAVDLDVTRFEIFDPNAVIVEAGDGKERAIPRPELLLLRGSVRDHPGSSVFLGLSPSAMNGHILLDGRTYMLSSGPAGSPLPAVIYDLGAVPPERMRLTIPPCLTDSLVQPPPARPSGPTDHVACRVVNIALDTDYEYNAGVFAGNTSNATAYAGTLLGAVYEIYRRDFNAAINIVYLRVWRTDTDPYTAADIGGRLGELQNSWNAGMGSVNRNIAHLLSGIGGGGVAYVGVLCPGAYSYGASASISGYFPYPLIDHSSQNWDLMVTAHEIGHNFNAPHTHSMIPPVDGCGSDPQDCSLAYQGTIMSYCHICPGGMTNILLQFHPRTINETVLPFLAGPASSCAVATNDALILAQPQPVAAFTGQSAAFSVTAGGDGPRYFQWMKDGADLVNTPRISGSQTSALSIVQLAPSDAGVYTVHVYNPCGGQVSTDAPLSVTCYANCDASSSSPVLNANDFQCFLNAFASGQSYANCDNSSTAPLLNANDFQCYLNKFATGCP